MRLTDAPPKLETLCRVMPCSSSQSMASAEFAHRVSTSSGSLDVYKRQRQNMQTTARRRKRQRTQSRALTVVLLAVVLLGLLVRAWTMWLMK